MKDQKKIRLGLIGVGNWALFAHVRVLRLLPEYEIVAIYSQRKEAAKAAAKEYGIPHVAESLDALVTDPLVDQVLLLTTSQQHEEGSRGYLRLKSANPADASEIHANMLGDPRECRPLELADRELHERRSDLRRTLLSSPLLSGGKAVELLGAHR